jgi:translation initiation factor IF-1
MTVEQAADWLRRLTGQDFGTDAAAWSEWLRQHPAHSRPPVAPEFIGVVLEMRPGLECRIRLDTGSEVSAVIPRQVARRMFRVVPGDRIRIRLSEPGCSRVVGFAPTPEAEPAAAPDPAS